jgi:hypothetical protein
MPQAIGVPRNRGHRRIRAPFQAGQIICAPQLTEIRHGYVHAKRRRRKIVLSAPNLAIFQAWQLSLWYQELALLYFLGHRGEYRNRVTAECLGIAETVPWA